MTDPAAPRSRLVLWGAFIVLVGLVLTLLVRAYQQSRLEAFYQQRDAAEQIVQRVDERLRTLLVAEASRPVEQYEFAVPLEGQPNAYRQSPLAALPETLNVPGLVSYFQIDAKDALSTPLLPKQAGVAELAAAEASTERLDKELQVRRILSVPERSLSSPEQDEEGLFERIQKSFVSNRSRYNKPVSDLKLDDSLADRAGAGRKSDVTPVADLQVELVSVQAKKT